MSTLQECVGEIVGQVFVLVGPAKEVAQGGAVASAGLSGPMLPDPDRGEIGERLRAYMGVHKISRAALALKSGISRTPLSNKLDGKTDFTVEEVTAIANALGKSWIWVLTGRDPRPAGGPDDDGGVVRPKGFEPLTFCAIAGGAKGQVIPVKFGRDADDHSDEDKVA